MNPTARTDALLLEHAPTNSLAALALTPSEAGARGRACSVRRCTPDQVEVAMRAIAGIRPGVEFSVNRVRDQLDTAAVPTSARAGLFERAVGAGLIERVSVIAGGRILAVTEPSTGGTARGARVRVYRRTATPYRAGTA